MSQNNTSKLVLFIEEQYTDNGLVITDSTCYVIYDVIEREYFICGSRLSHEDKAEYCKYHLYCKSRRDLINFLSFIFNADGSNVNYGIYKYDNIFSSNELIDYDFLNENKLDNEVTLYLDMKFKKSNIVKLLDVIKFIRY